MAEHGGRIRAAAARYGLPPECWVDLSTGINPHGWPVPPVPADTWSRLPEPDDGLIAAANTYYKTKQVLPVAGSQAAIQAIPLLRPRSHVAILAPGYVEHELAWRRAGHLVELLTYDEIDCRLSQFDVLVLINPGNPSGVRFARQDLNRWHAALAERGGWLVLDEAFIDATPQDSLASRSDQTGLIVLRSLGKFFGLAGARVGFVLAQTHLLGRLDDLLGPWTVNGPARQLATLALRDQDWQSRARARLRLDAQRLNMLLRDAGLPPAGGTALFQWVVSAQAHAISESLARQGLLIRLFAEPCSMRFGLPSTEPDWQRLSAALATVVKSERLAI